MNFLLIGIIIVLLIVALSFSGKNTEQSNKINKLESDNNQLSNEVYNLNNKCTALEEDNKKLSSRNEELEVYSSALDADKEAQERLANAKVEAENIKAQAYQDLQSVKDETDLIEKNNH